MFDLVESVFQESYLTPSLHRPKAYRIQTSMLTRYYLFPKCISTFAQMGGRKKDANELEKLVL
jgi:hypothetical protein